MFDEYMAGLAGDSWSSGEFDSRFVVLKDNGWGRLRVTEIGGKLAKIDDVFGALGESFVFCFAGVE